MPNILVVDDQEVVRYGTTLILQKSIEDAHVSEAASFEDTLKTLSTKTFDLVILDIDMPGGNNHQMLDVIRLRHPDIKILIFSSYDEQIFGWRYLEAGADGFLSKKTGIEEIKNAVKTLLRDEKYLSPTLKQTLLNNFTNKKAATNPIQRLSSRENNIMQLLIKGSSVAEIAERLSLQISTVSTYKKRIFEKLQVSNVIEMIEKVQLYS
ncbi:response regulator [Chitinophaga ginsengisoli]|uniref:LuxR family two component transcriptional regulator n=1 Tax=Chitinophaga ginsengisoli TaxID=363837 RepID=A0A2P8FX61_9BACT|nr:response regulator transcription factor [Chitinophaga ginsengisoli]PSL26291.1 LuxR family two component transcriptional regulator [Chitinophaga ginsengisoli]